MCVPVSVVRGEKKRPITRLKLVLLPNQPLTPLDPSAVIPQKKRMRARERGGEKSYNRQSGINEENVGELKMRRDGMA